MRYSQHLTVLLGGGNPGCLLKIDVNRKVLKMASICGNDDIRKAVDLNITWYTENINILWNNVQCHRNFDSQRHVLLFIRD